MNKIKFRKETLKDFEKRRGYVPTDIINMGNKCYICGKKLFYDEAWFVYYIGLMCGSPECDTMLLLQYAEYLI
jgi:hypothetical protein